MTDDGTYMRLALDEAEKGASSPNPHVGAVVVDPRTGEVLGRGFHPRPGREHAEVAAIAAAGHRARGATLYVTLEPCNHHGRTPPCTDAILSAGIARVVVGVRDPNPHVVGGGNERLRAWGVTVDEGVEEEACARIIAPFAKHVRTGLPFVRLKLAASIDGRIAAASGVSKWITGPDARRAVHALRARVDAVAVGIGTALADDPSLTVRDVPPLEGREPPTRIVVDSDARLPESARVLDAAAPTIVVVAADADAARLSARAKVLRVPRGHGGVDLRAALEALGRENVLDLLVEGGSLLAGSLVAGDLVDEIRWFVAPIALGERGLPSLVGLAPESPDQAPRYRLNRVVPCGGDVELVLTRAPS